MKYGVNVVFPGHDHVYERIKPQQGIYYFVEGSSGKLRPGDLRKTALTEVGNDRDQSFMIVEIDDDDAALPGHLAHRQDDRFRHADAAGKAEAGAGAPRAAANPEQPLRLCVSASRVYLCVLVLFIAPRTVPARRPAPGAGAPIVVGLVWT